jgi:stage III sporulation protein AF
MEQMISDWARQLAFLVLFATVVEMILPAGDLRRYVKMVLGLMVVLAVVDPLVRVIQGSDWMEVALGPLAVGAPAENAVAAGIRLTQAAMSQAESDVRADTEEQMAALLLALEGVAEAQVELAHGPPLVKVWAEHGTDTASLERRVRAMTAAFLGVNPETVMVQLEVLGGL